MKIENIPFIKRLLEEQETIHQGAIASLSSQLSEYKLLSAKWKRKYQDARKSSVQNAIQVFSLQQENKRLQGELTYYSILLDRQNEK